MTVLDVAWVEPETFYLTSVANRDRSFWLDGSGARPWSGQMSYVGWLEPDELSLTWHAADRAVTAHGGGASRVVGSDIFAEMDRSTPTATRSRTSAWVGFFGYAARTDLPAQLDEGVQSLDACWLRATRYVGFDHDRQRMYAICPPADRAAWALEVSALLTERPMQRPVQASSLGASSGSASASATSESELLLESSRGHRAPVVLDTWAPPAYQQAFDQVQNELRSGNSYETNLTFRTTLSSAADPVRVYLQLRRLSPAPYAALITHDGTRLLSSSPERFASIDATGLIETRPIKGTTARDADPMLDAAAAHRLVHEPKFRAENLMIVDLLRNDLAQVCQVGSVQVTELMHVESYPTVHQLVTTIQGRLTPSVTTLGAVRALMPGGSMTGAPKRRTMQIIAEVESTPRGAYAGALGWIRDDGSADLGIVIRTLMWREGLYTMGTGGGITVRSECADEYAEAALKLQALMRAVSASH